MADYRIFVEKKPEFRVEAESLRGELNENLQLNLKTLRLLNVYDLFGFTPELLEKTRSSVFGEIVTDSVTDSIDLSGKFTGGYEFELEILVYSAWKGVKVANIPVSVSYPPDRVSHFKPLRDFARISILNTILVAICFFWRWPASFFRKLTWTNVKSFIDRNIIHSPESNARIASSVMLGCFMGILPIWGYQMVCAFALAHLLKLNKVIVLVASNISLPPLIPFIIFGSYWLGCTVLGQPMIFSMDNFSLEVAGTVLLQYILGAVLLAALVSAVSWLITFTVLVACGRHNN